MATLKQRLHKRNSSGSYDIVYLETNTDMVLLTDGSTTLTSKLSTMDSNISGKAASGHKHTATDITSGTLDAARIPTLAASKINAGTFAATGVKAKSGTDYTTARVRNIQASTTDLTAGSSALTNGDIYLVYE